MIWPHMHMRTKRRRRDTCIKAFAFLVELLERPTVSRLNKWTSGGDVRARARPRLVFAPYTALPGHWQLLSTCHRFGKEGKDKCWGVS